jgi:hypothetical protein
MASKCDPIPLPEAAKITCYREYSYGSVQVPLHEFENVLLSALDLIGIRTYPKNASVSLLEGIPQGGPGPLNYESAEYERHAWSVCPPPGVVDTRQAVRPP